MNIFYSFLKCHVECIFNDIINKQQWCVSVLSKLNMDSVPRPVKLMKGILTAVLPPALLNVQTGGGDLVLPKELQSVKIFQVIHYP